MKNVFFSVALVNNKRMFWYRTLDVKVLCVTRTILQNSRASERDWDSAHRFLVMSQILISPARVSVKIIRPDCLCRSGTRLSTRGWSREPSSGPDQTSTSTEASPTSTNLTTGKTLCFSLQNLESKGSGCAPSLHTAQINSCRLIRTCGQNPTCLYN